MRVTRKGLRIDPERFEMKYAHLPTVQGGLSSTIIIDNKYYVNLSFNFGLVQYAGRILPRGVSPFLPAFMTMNFDVKEQVYRVYVQYIDKARQGEYFDLLVFKERPKWMKYMRPLPGMVEPAKQSTRVRTKHGNTNPAEQRA